MDKELPKFYTRQQLADEYGISYSMCKTMVARIFPKKKKGLLTPKEVKRIREELEGKD